MVIGVLATACACHIQGGSDTRSAYVTYLAQAYLYLITIFTTLTSFKFHS